jgi:hypothetical protein
MKWKTDIERHRVRRTLSLVKRKLEEALRLSRLRNESEHGQSTAAHRHR